MLKKDGAHRILSLAKCSDSNCCILLQICKICRVMACSLIMKLDYLTFRVHYIHLELLWGVTVMYADF